MAPYLSGWVFTNVAAEAILTTYTRKEGRENWAQACFQDEDRHRRLQGLYSGLQNCSRHGHRRHFRQQSRDQLRARPHQPALEFGTTADQFSETGLRNGIVVIGKTSFSFKTFLFKVATIQISSVPGHNIFRRATEKITRERFGSDGSNCKSTKSRKWFTRGRSMKVTGYVIGFEYNRAITRMKNWVLGGKPSPHLLHRWFGCHRRAQHLLSVDCSSANEGFWTSFIILNQHLHSN